MKRIHLYLCALLPFLLLPAGCQKDDYSICPTVIKVYFSYPPHREGEGFDPAEVGRINLFVFDKNGILSAVAEDASPRLSPAYSFTIRNLPEGEYRFAAWGGLGGDYSIIPEKIIPGVTAYNESMLVFSHGGKVTHTIGHLFFAGLNGAKVTTERKQSFTLPIVQNTYTIRLTTEGLPADNDAYSVRIQDNNGKFFFDNSLAPCADFTTLSSCTKNAKGQLYANFRLLKLDPLRQCVIELWNDTAGTVCYRGDLIQLLNVRGTDYNKEYRLNIHLKFSTNMNIEVTISAWQETANELNL